MTQENLQNNTEVGVNHDNVVSNFVNILLKGLSSGTS